MGEVGDTCGSLVGIGSGAPLLFFFVAVCRTGYVRTANFTNMALPANVCASGHVPHALSSRHGHEPGKEESTTGVVCLCISRKPNIPPATVSREKAQGIYPASPVWLPPRRSAGTGPPCT